MTVNYSVALLANPSDPEAEKKAYARAQISGEMTLNEMARLVAMQTTVSRADVTAVLIATVENMILALEEGKQVDFGDLGKFRIQLTSKGTKTAEEFTANNINGASIQFVPGEDLKDIFSKLTFNLVPSRKAMKAVLKAEKSGETIVDLSKDNEEENDDPNNSGGGGNGGGNNGDDGGDFGV